MKDLDLEFDFSEDRERFSELSHLKKGDRVRLEQLILWFGDRPEEEAEEAALDLERRGVDLDVSGYRKAGASGAAAQRLEQEEKLTAEGRLEGYLFKDAVKNRVFVTDTPQPGSKTAVTKYRTLAQGKGLSLVECELLTGRTHQIRAQFAHAGHPLLGDGKYGKLGKDAIRKYQALYSYKLTFTFPTDAGVLNYLKGKTFTVSDVDFARELFPGAAQF